jgi:hypothetical protein
MLLSPYVPRRSKHAFFAALHWSAVGTKQNNAHATDCPLLAKADVPSAFQRLAPLLQKETIS